jgi:predicted Rossmann fold flavoprotein
MRLAVIGGGASGMTAAITAARLGADVTIYERTDRVGKKILATGNGRCNMTNTGADETHYYGADRRFVRGALMRFDVLSTLDFFAQLGIVAKTEDEGRVYPYSSQASSVLDVLRFELERLGVRIVTGFEVKEIKRLKNGFEIAAYNGVRELCDKVIMAVGGKASPQLGSNGSGYDILKKLGHTVTPLYPALVQIKTETGFVKPLKGIKLDAEISIVKGGKKVRTEFGELLFTEYGISGLPVFKASVEVCGAKNASVLIDMMPEYNENEVLSMLRARRGVTLENYFVGMLNKRLGQTVLKHCGIAPLSRSSDSLTDNELLRAAHAVKSLELRIEGTMSWNNAQATMGGINVREVSPSTMESKIVKGLYITGELLDVCGDCGGYNLQWAWSSGMAAGTDAARS